MKANHARTLAARASVVLVLCAIATACGRSDGGPRRDAGSSAPSVTDSATWRLGEARVRIGQDGAPGHELDRVYGGVIGPDGSLAVGNAGTGEIRFFDDRGALRKVAGRKGRGPGEFQSINWLRPFRGDSLIAFDMQVQRFSIWSRDGVFARTVQIRAGPGFVRPVGVFGDGSILMAADQPYDPRTGPRVVRDQSDLLRVDAEGTPLGSLGRFSGTEWLLYRNQASFGAVQVPFGRTRHVAVSGEHVFLASSDSGVVTVHDQAGRQVRTIRVAAAARPLRPEEVDHALFQIPDEPQRKALREHLASRRANAMAPVILDLRTDRVGRLWVRTFASAPDHHRWLVFDASGRREGSVVMPSDYLPLDIDRDRVLVRQTGADGVQHVVLHGVAP